MRYISNNIRYLLARPKAETFYLFSIIGKGIDLKMTTYFEPVTVAGLGTFSHENSITAFQPPVMETASNREAYKMSFTDTDFQLREIAELNLIGARAKFYMVLVNTSDQTIGGAAPGMPLLNLQDITLGFDGIIDAKDYTINPFENVNLLNIECSTPMASLGITRPYMTSRNALAQIDPLDTAYDGVYKGSEGVNLLWGKMP